MRKTAGVLLGLVLIAVEATQAFTIEKLQVPSAAMKRPVNVQVIVPDGYRASSTPLPVVYLLHGFSDDESAWPTKSSIGDLADKYGMLVVCPDGDNSWYFDSPENPAMKFETFVSAELVGFVDERYRTIRDRGGRALAGLSMGGHGALFLSIRHPHTFGAAASMSGGVDIRHSPNKWEIAKTLGPIEANPDRWEELAVVTQAKSLKDGDLAISIDCGVGDFFLDVNRALHKQLLEQKITHDYAERPGEHNWDYWGRSIAYQMLFLSEFFGRAARP